MSKNTLWVIFAAVLVTSLLWYTVTTMFYAQQPPTISSVPPETQSSIGTEYVLQRFLAKYPTSEYTIDPSVAYSDGNVVAMWEHLPNGGKCLNLYEAQTLSPITKTEGDANACVWSENLETKGYFINVSDDGIRYYKLGSDQIVLIPGSSLLVTKDEATGTETYYQQEDGLDRRVNANFDESTKTLAVTVFKRSTAKEGVSTNTKERTVNFTLP